MIKKLIIHSCLAPLLVFETLHMALIVLFPPYFQWHPSCSLFSQASLTASHVYHVHFYNSNIHLPGRRLFFHLVALSSSVEYVLYALLLNHCCPCTISLYVISENYYTNQFLPNSLKGMYYVVWLICNIFSVLKAYLRLISGTKYSFSIYFPFLRVGVPKLSEALQDPKCLLNLSCLFCSLLHSFNKHLLTTLWHRHGSRY